MPINGCGRRSSSTWWGKPKRGRLQCRHQCGRESPSMAAGAGAPLRSGAGQDGAKHGHLQCRHQRVRESPSMEASTEESLRDGAHQAGAEHHHLQCRHQHVQDGRSPPIIPMPAVDSPRPGRWRSRRSGTEGVPTNPECRRAPGPGEVPTRTGVPTWALPVRGRGGPECRRAPGPGVVQAKVWRSSIANRAAVSTRENASVGSGHWSSTTRWGTAGPGEARSPAAPPSARARKHVNGSGRWSSPA
jgi:hypothetical protein